MDEKAMAKEFMMKLMESALKRAPHNVPQPIPLIEEKANNRLNQDDLISWKLMLKEWQNVSATGKKDIAILLTLNSHDIVECLNLGKRLCEETKGTVEYIADHPEYGKAQEDINAENIVDSIMNDLGLD